MELLDLRKHIDEIDEKILMLFLERLDLALKAGKIKQSLGKAVLDEKRELEILEKIGLQSGENQDLAMELFKKIIALSRQKQEQTLWQNACCKFRIAVINGPNINLLGIREPDIYGKDSYEALCGLILEKAEQLGVSVTIYQSNSEGAIVDKLQSLSGNADAVIINPAAYTHTSIAILDALKAISLPAAEVHLTDINGREDFRRISYIEKACEKTFSGEGFNSYLKAMEYLYEKYGGQNE